MEWPLLIGGVVLNKANKAFWIWLAFLIAFNVIPLGNSLNKNLTGHKFIFRLDYLFHFISFLVFALIYCIAHRKGLRVFKTYEFGKFTAIVLAAAILLETFQIGLPYRAFNPWDLASNLAGATVTIVAVTLLTLLSSKSAHYPYFE